MTPAPVGRGADQIGAVELGLAEECFRAVMLELDDLAQEDARGRRRQPADAVEVGLAVVAREVLEHGAQIREVEERKARLVGEVEDENQRRRLGLVRVHHLGQELRPERRDGGAHRYARAVPAEGQEGDGVPGRRPVETELGCARRHPLVGHTRLQEATEVALHVGREHRDAHGRQLFGHELQRLGLARPRRPGDQSVAIAHRGRELNRGVRDHLPGDHAAAERHHRAVGLVRLGDPGPEFFRCDVGHAARTIRLWDQGRPRGCPRGTR